MALHFSNSNANGMIPDMAGHRDHHHQQQQREPRVYDGVSDDGVAHRNEEGCHPQFLAAQQEPSFRAEDIFEWNHHSHDNGSSSRNGIFSSLEASGTSVLDSRFRGDAEEQPCYHDANANPISIEPLPIEPSRITIVPRVTTSDFIRCHCPPRSSPSNQSPGVDDFFLEMNHNQHGIMLEDAEEEVQNDISALLDVLRPLIASPSSSSKRKSVHLVPSSDYHLQQHKKKRRKSSLLKKSAANQKQHQIMAEQVSLPLYSSALDDPAAVLPPSNWGSQGGQEHHPHHAHGQLDFSPGTVLLQQWHDEAGGGKRSSSSSSSSASKSSSSDKEDEESSGETHIRRHQRTQWQARFNELCIFKEKHGHCAVPYTFKHFPQLAQWTKRQRYQMTLKLQGKHSTLTEERQQILDSIGFVWDSHHAMWEEKYQELVAFHREHGHCLVGGSRNGGHGNNPSLAVWIKCQRRQMKLKIQGRPSNITDHRIERLNGLGFCWEPRRNSKKK